MTATHLVALWNPSYAADALAVPEELRKLRVITYNDRPVSLCGGMVNLPLLVKRPDGTRFFEPEAAI